MRIPSKKLHVALLLVTVFSASFAVLFLVMYLTPSPYLHERAYFMPVTFFHSPDIAPCSIGPALNATDVPLDTTIVADQMRPMGINELQLSPAVPIARRVDENIGLAGKCTTYYFSEPLQPATTYNVTLFFSNTPVSWNFTTTAEPYHPRYDDMPSALGISVAATASAIITLTVATIMRKKKQRHS